MAQPSLVGAVPRLSMVQGNTWLAHLALALSPSSTGSLVLLLAHLVILASGYCGGTLLLAGLADYVVGTSRSATSPSLSIAAVIL